jgi:hypothetical protein
MQSTPSSLNLTENVVSFVILFNDPEKSQALLKHANYCQKASLDFFITNINEFIEC